MNVHAVGRGPAHQALRPDHRAARGPSGTSASTGVSDGTDAAGEVAGAAAGPVGDRDAPGPTTPGGNSTPFTHALERGNGAKVGIHRRMAEWVATQQAESGLGGTTGGVDEATGGTAPVGDTVPIEGQDAPDAPVEGEGPDEIGAGVTDGEGSAGATASGDEPGLIDVPHATGTIAIDGSTLLDAADPWISDGWTPDELLDAAAKDGRATLLEELGGRPATLPPVDA